jgi:hypothetical protein
MPVVQLAKHVTIITDAEICGLVSVLLRVVVARVLSGGLPQLNAHTQTDLNGQILI